MAIQNGSFFFCFFFFFFWYGVLISCLQGVHAILAADPSLQDSMLELLLPHFTLFLQGTDDAPPLKLDLCTGLQVNRLAVVYEPAIV